MHNVFLCYLPLEHAFIFTSMLRDWCAIQLEWLREEFHNQITTRLCLTEVNYTYITFMSGNTVTTIRLHRIHIIEQTTRH